MAQVLHRRRLIAGLAAVPLVSAARPAAAAAAGPYLDYERRLRAELAQPAGEPLGDLTAALFAEVNAFRARNGRSALPEDTAVAMCARAHVSDMTRRDYFAHEAPDGITLKERTGLLLRRVSAEVGENIVFIGRGGAPTAPTPAEIIAVWQTSSIHRTNLLDPKWTHLGLAITQSGASFRGCAVFARIGQRLAADVPLQAGADGLGAILKGASPAVSGYFISTPAGRPEQRRYTLDGPAPQLAPGAWRLRPVVGGETLWGPVFVV